MQSMTGFGRATCTVGGLSYRMELRALNSRFLDLRLRFPWNDAEVEANATAFLRERLSRGRVELSVSEQGGGATTESVIELDEAVARGVWQSLSRFATLCGGDLGTAAMLMPPVPELLRVHAPAPSTDEIWAPFSLALQAAVDQLVAMREREGNSLGADITRHLGRLQDIVREVTATLEDEPQRLAERLKARLAQLSVAELDAGRVAQEAAVLAERADVSEELARLGSHAEQLAAMLARSEPVGRAIEFMLQEVNRELNTVASKTSSPSVTTRIIEAKGLVEKMREQAQNVE